MKKFLNQFLKEKPFFFATLRPKEADLYQKYKPFKKPVLDLGCGDGFFAQVAFGKIDAGIDPDHVAITEARQRKIYKEIKEYNGKKIPYPNNYFSTILCNSTLEHIQNQEEVLRETARVLKKGGVFYFTTPTDKWSLYLLGPLIFGKWYARFFTKKSKHYHMYSAENWHKKLADLGLEIFYLTHYLDSKKIMWLFEISHYLSVSSLITKKLFNRWVLFPEKTALYKPIIEYLEIHTKRNAKIGPYIFIAARKRRDFKKR